MNAKNVLDKIKIALECDTYIDIANKLEVTPGAVDNWKKRNAIPNKYLLKVAEDTGVSLDWLLDEDKPTFHISGGKGVVALQTNHGDGGGQHNTFGSKKEKSVKKEENNIDEGTFILFKEAYMKAEKNKEINRLRLYLMEF